MTAHRHTANPRRGGGAGGKNKAALAHSIPQASLSRAALLHCRARGSSLAPTGRRSFVERAAGMETGQGFLCFPPAPTPRSGFAGWR